MRERRIKIPVPISVYHEVNRYPLKGNLIGNYIFHRAISSLVTALFESGELEIEEGDEFYVDLVEDLQLSVYSTDRTIKIITLAKSNSLLDEGQVYEEKFIIRSVYNSDN